MKIKVDTVIKKYLLVIICLGGVITTGFTFSFQTTLSLVLEEMSEKYQVFFTYNSLELGNIEVEFVFDENERLDKAINRLLLPTNYTYESYGKKYYVIYEKTSVGKKQAKKMRRHLKGIQKLEDQGLGLKRVKNDPIQQIQQILHSVIPDYLATITGTVTDVDGVPLIGVNIRIKSTDRGAVTDVDGTYRLDLAEGEDVLIFSYIGYLDQEVLVAGRSVVDVTMAQSETALDEIVVVGYGTQRRADLTGSIVSIQAEDLKDLPNPNVFDQVQGRLPGLTIANTNAAPGADPTILIRGTNSINASNFPLIVMDGIPYAGSLTSITPGDIESISVLKDASATAIYGSRGANGVILITTKKGRKDLSPTITLDSRMAFNNQLKKLDVLDVDQYVDFKNTFGAAANWPLQPSEQENLAAGRTVDWQDLVGRTGTQFDNTLSIRGGGDQMRYFASFSRLDQEGIVLGSEYNRTSARLNGDYDITNWLTIGTQLLLSEEDRGDKPAISQNLVTLLSPLGIPYNEDGTNTQYPVPEDPFFINPLDILNNYRKSVVKRLQSNFYTTVDLPIEGLSYRLNYGRLEQRVNTDAFNPSTSLAGTGGGSASRSLSTTIDYTIENLLYYKRNFGDHKIDLTALYSFQEATSDGSSLSDGNFVSDALTFYGVGSGENDNSIGASYSQRNLISQMGRLAYGYRNKYNATYTIRRDGSSVFGANNKWATFHSGSLAWTLSEEDFFQSVDWIDFLKLRVSFGSSGNQAISPYQTGTRINRGGGYYFDGPAVNFGPSNLANPDLRWESTETLNFGLTFNLLSNRLSGTFEWYKSTSKDLLRNRSLNPTQGFGSVISNIGSLENRGVELALNGVIIENSDFSWDASISFFKNKNEVLILDGKNQDLISDNLFIGEDIATIFGYKFGGVYNDEAEIAGSHQPDAKPGDGIILDVDGDGAITPDDRTIIGRESPDWTMGITNNINFKNFNLSFFAYILQGEKRINNFINSRFWGGDARISYVDIDFWTPTNTDAAYPSPTYTDDRIRLLEERDYFRLRNVTLGYTFENSLINRIGLSDLRLYIAGNNLLTITDWSGSDPETLNTGGELGNYPSSKSFVLGLNVSL